MTDTYPEGVSASAEQLRREAVEIIRRRDRGLPAYRAHGTEPSVREQHERAIRALAAAQEYSDEGRSAEALLRIDTAIGLAAHGSRIMQDGLALRGEISLAAGNVQTARAEFRRALALNPAHVGARLGMVESFRLRGDHERAIPALIETIALITDEQARLRLHLLLAELYRASGQPEAARRLLSAQKLPIDRMSGGDLARLTAILLRPIDSWSWLALVLLISIPPLVALTRDAFNALLLMAALLLLYLLLQWRHRPRR